MPNLIIFYQNEADNLLQFKTNNKFCDLLCNHLKNILFYNIKNANQILNGAMF